MPAPSSLPSAFEVLPRLARGRPRLFLDYDGTLTPIVTRPEEAVLAPEMREVLARLVEVAEVTVVTGRDLEDVLALLAPLGPDAGMAVAGSHGFELARTNGRREVLGSGEAFLPALDAAARRLESAIPPLEGVRLERKRFALALHFREAPHREAEVVALASEVVRAEPLLRLGGGKMVVELRPDTEWDKGRLVSALLAAGEGSSPPQPSPGAASEGAAAYLGDDVTDEDAFEALARLDPPSVGVIVGERVAGETAADYALSDVLEVRQWLEELASRLEGSRG